jgi:hypothetical protein
MPRASRGAGRRRRACQRAVQRAAVHYMTTYPTGDALEQA